MPNALITGIAGQDGSFLAELLISKGYAVHGIIRRHSIIESQQSRIHHLLAQITCHYGDVTDVASVENAIRACQPDEIYSLAAQSHVGISSECAYFTLQVNGVGHLNVLDAARRSAPDARIYFAGSSEMFGSACDNDGRQRETTPMHVVSPYGAAKLYAFSMHRHYRHAHKQWNATGILFNHTSTRRGSNFVCMKVVKTAVEIKLGLHNELVLGNMDSQRDWGSSRDYVRAMHMILQHSEPDDFVVATGITRSVRDLCSVAFSKLGLDYRNYLRVDPRFMRPEELPYLCGDSSKARRTLGWSPRMPFDMIIDEMLEHWMRECSAHS